MRPYNKLQVQIPGLCIVLGLLGAALSPSPVWADETVQVLRCSNVTTSAESKAKTKSCAGTKPAPPTKEEKAELQKCRFEATKAATEAGMRLALALCEDKFKP